MRIIAGEAKGRQLKTVPGRRVRPTADRVKESFFQIMGPYFEGGWVLDLFAGSGSLGLETLSRGAERAVFVDSSPASVATVRKNLKGTGFVDRAEVYKRDARAVLRVLARRGISFRYIFLDPPYGKNFLPDLLGTISERGLLEPGGVLLAEHGSDSRLQPQYNSLSLIRNLVYGDTVVDLYRVGDGEVEINESGSLSREL